MDTLRPECIVQGLISLVLCKRRVKYRETLVMGVKKLEFHGTGIRVDKGGLNRGQIGKKTKQPPGRGLLS